MLYNVLLFIRMRYRVSKRTSKKCRCLWETPRIWPLLSNNLLRGPDIASQATTITGRSLKKLWYQVGKLVLVYTEICTVPFHSVVHYVLVSVCRSSNRGSIHA